MDRPHVNLHYEREFPYPVDVAYAWLTDYQDDDHQRAGAIIKRRDVVRREVDKDGRAVEYELEGELETLGLKTGPGRVIVKLEPDRHAWQAIFPRGSWVYSYRVVPAPRGSKIVIDYRFGSRRWTRRLAIWVAKPRIRRELDVMWDGFSAAMEREIGTSASRAGAPSP